MDPCQIKSPQPSQYESRVEQNVHQQWIRIRFNRWPGQKSDVDANVVVPKKKKVRVALRPRPRINSEDRWRYVVGWNAASSKAVRKIYKGRCGRARKPTVWKQEDLSSEQLKTLGFKFTDCCGLVGQGKGAEILEYAVEKWDKGFIDLLKYLTAVFAIYGLLWWGSLLCDELTVAVAGFMVPLICYLVWTKITKETLMVVGNAGLQIEKFNMFGKSRMLIFVPGGLVQAVTINEIIKKQRVIPYLMVQLKLHKWKKVGRLEEAVPLFQEFLPRLGTIEKMYSDIHAVRTFAKIPTKPMRTNSRSPERVWC